MKVFPSIASTAMDESAPFPAAAFPRTADRNTEREKGPRAGETPADCVGRLSPTYLRNAVCKRLYGGSPVSSRFLRKCILVCALGACQGAPVPSGGLTIYRLGGESLPAPDAGGLAPAGSIRFVQLPWSDAHGAPFGSAHLVVIQPDSVRADQVALANLTPEIVDRGGRIQVRHPGREGWGTDDELIKLLDGDPQTAFNGGVPPWEAERNLASAGSPFCVSRPNYCKYIHMILPGAYPLQRIRIYPIPGNEENRFIPTYTLGISDGDPLKFGRQDRTFGNHSDSAVFIVGSFDLVSEVAENNEPLLEFDFDDEPVKEVVFIAPIGNWEIAEFELLFDGFANAANYTTNLIDFGEPGTLGPVTWSGALHPGANVDIRVRAGDTTDPNLYFRNTFRGRERSRLNAEGRPLVRSEYFGLEAGEQAGIAPDLDNWSHWSSVLEFARGEEILPQRRPRRYVQLSADFRSGGRLDFFEFSVSQPPIVTGGIAEIGPGAVPARERSRFSFVFSTEISVGDLGFDSIRIETPALVDSVVSVAVEGRQLDPSEWGQEIGPNDFTVRIPRMDDRNTGDLVEVLFDARIYSFGTEFHGRVFDSEKPWEVPHLLAAGDADFRTDNNALSVELSNVAARTLEDLHLSSPVFTPNADGVNDLLDLEFDLVNLSAAVPASILVYDLTGGLVADLPLAPLTSGPHRAGWDGRDGRGELLPPGIYLLRLKVDADDGEFSVERLVSLAY